MIVKLNALFAERVLGWDLTEDKLTRIVRERGERIFDVPDFTADSYSSLALVKSCLLAIGVSQAEIDKAEESKKDDDYR